MKVLLIAAALMVLALGCAYCTQQAIYAMADFITPITSGDDWTQ